MGLVLQFAQGDFPEKPAIFGLRTEVFVDEQKAPLEEEFDLIDETALHLIAQDGSAVVGTLRIFPYYEGAAKIGRVAVRKDYRSKGIGAAMMNHAIEHVRADGYGEVIIEAQTYAIPFYERLGFIPEGEEYMDAGIPHYKMRLKL